jgi:SHS2 domain-containing protein
MNPRMTYRIFDHTADLGVEVMAATAEGIYAGAAFALFDLLADLRSVRELMVRAIDVTGENPADLLVNFLREILYTWNGAGFLVKRCTVTRLTSARIEATLAGEPFDPARHRIIREIKAVTYHQSEVRQLPEGGWRCRVIFDV